MAVDARRAKLMREFNVTRAVLGLVEAISFASLAEACRVETLERARRIERLRRLGLVPTAICEQLCISLQQYRRALEVCRDSRDTFALQLARADVESA